MSRTFYLHEDDWGMIEVLPGENLARRQEIAREAEQFGAEHFDGTSWTDIYVIPEAEHSIAGRKIALSELRALVCSWLPEADEVQSGYSTHREALQRSFAFGGTDRRLGALYGNHDGDTITALNMLRPDEEDGEAVARFGAALTALGERHNLMLTDWWMHLTVDLQDKNEVISYLRSEGDS